MAGHGSPPDPDRGRDPARQVHRDSGMHTETHDFSHLVGRPTPAKIQEYRPPVGAKVPLSDRGTRFAYDIGAATDLSGGQSARRGSVRTLPRARVAVRAGAQRLGEKRDLYSGKPY
jgi:hypothetical protein